ncbi:MAG: NAD-dependent epimerase/dehydratase family protein, partial [Chitinophagaceae bacterium]
TVTGTCFEYGMQEGCLSEEFQSLPANSYAKAKNELRLLLTGLKDHHDFDLKWIRLFYMYGEGQSPKSLLSQLQLALDSGDRIFNMSPGDQMRDYLEVKKVAEYIVAIAVQKAETGVINCCSGNPISVKDLVVDYLTKRNADIKLNMGYYPYSDIEPKHFWGDTRKLKTILTNG